MFQFRKNKFLQKLRSEKSHRYKFLVIRNGLLGDTVFVAPVIEKLFREYKNSIIDFSGSSIGGEVLKNIRGLNNVFAIPPFKISKHIKFFISLRKNKYDCVFVQEMNTHYSLMSKLTGAKLVIGYNHSLKALHDFSLERKGHVVEAEQQLVNFITGSSDVIPPKLITSIEEDTSAEKILSEHNLNNKKLAVIQSSCSEQNSIRQLSHQKLALIADRLCDDFGLHILFPGTKSETEEIEKIRRIMKNDSVSLAGKTNIRDLIAIVKKVKIVIGPDTGTLHVANAVEIPVIMYTGWAIPEDTGPFDLSGRSIVIKANLECIPCKYVEPKPANWEYCKINRPTLCMDKIEVDEIIEAAKYVLTNC